MMTAPSIQYQKRRDFLEAVLECEEFALGMLASLA